MRVFLNKEGRDIIKQGIDLSVDTIKTTLGGCGKTSIIFAGGIVYSTKDGVTVARHCIFEGDLNIGSSIIRNSTEQTLQDAGDGTTATAILTQKIIEYGFTAIEQGADQAELKIGIDKAVEIVSKEIDKMAVQVGDDNDKIRNIATISSNNDSEIGGLIADAFNKMGNDGAMFIEESKSFETFVRIDKGFKIPNGYISPLFCAPDSVQVELTNPRILFYDGKIDKMKDLIPVLQDWAKVIQTVPQILVMCDNVEGEALKTFIVNRAKGAMNVVCVNAPSFGSMKDDLMEDMAAITAGTFISLNKGIKDFDIKYWGSAEKVLVTKDETTIMGGKGNAETILARIQQIDGLILQSDSEKVKEFYKERKAKLKGKMSVISVGSATQQEMKEKRDRVEDSVRSVFCAIEAGIVPGGGVCLLQCSKALDNVEGISKDQKIGIEIVRKALYEPLTQILENAGIKEKDEIISQIYTGENGTGYNVKTRKIENLLESGVIDAAKVCKAAVKNSASVASIILMSESLIC